MAVEQVTFSAAKPQRAFDNIIEQVRSMLRSGQLRPGQKLPSERDFATQLGVSRNTVREAMRMLEIAGLVTLKRGHTGGAFVSDSNSDALTRAFADGLILMQYTITDLVDSRIAVETVTARKAAENATPEDVEELEASIARAREIASREKFDKVLQAHREFHETMIRIAGNPIMASLFQPLLDLTFDLSLRIGPRAGESLWEHRRLMLDALRQHDGDAAARSVEDYLTELRELWISSDQ